MNGIICTIETKENALIQLDNTKIKIPEFEELKFFTYKTIHKYKIQDSAIDFEDLIQDCYLLYLTCKEKFRNDVKIQFITYYGQVVTNHMRGLIRKYQRRTMCSLQAVISDDSTRITTLEDTLADESINLAQISYNAEQKKNNLQLACFAWWA